MLSLLFFATLANASISSDVKVDTTAISASSSGRTASELIDVLRKIAVKSTQSGDQEEFLISKGQMDRTGYGTCNPRGPGDYLAEFNVLDSASRQVIQHVSLENRGCQADAPAGLLDAMMIKFGQEKIGTADHLGTTTYWISYITCDHDTRKPAQQPDQCSVMLNSADLVPGWL